MKCYRSIFYMKASNIVALLQGRKMKSYLTRDKALQRERGDYTDTKTESTECGQVVVLAEILKYITSGNTKRKSKKDCHEYFWVSYTFLNSTFKLWLPDVEKWWKWITTCDLYNMIYKNELLEKSFPFIANDSRTGCTLRVAGKSCITCNRKDNADYDSWTHGHVRDQRPVTQRGLLQWPVDHEAVVMADKGWKRCHGNVETTKISDHTEIKTCWRFQIKPTKRHDSDCLNGIPASKHPRIIWWRSVNKINSIWRGQVIVQISWPTCVEMFSITNASYTFFGAWFQQIVFTSKEIIS